MKTQIVFEDGTPAEDEDMSFWWDENDVRTLDKVMDFTKHFPYWEELPRPKGFIDVIEEDGKWYWITDDNQLIDKL